MATPAGRRIGDWSSGLCAVGDEWETQRDDGARAGIMAVSG